MSNETPKRERAAPAGPREKADSLPIEHRANKHVPLRDRYQYGQIVRAYLFIDGSAHREGFVLDVNEQDRTVLVDFSGYGLPAEWIPERRL